MPKKLPQRPARRSGVALTGTVRVALHLRISTDETNQPYSMAAQNHALRTFIESQPGWEYAATYRDEASGTLGPRGRPGLAQLCADAEAGRFDLVLVQRVDRMAREISLLRDLIGRFSEAGVAFRSATQMFDTSDAMGNLILNILGVLAEFERDLLVDRILNGIAQKSREGRWVGGPAPYGYHLVNKSLHPHPTEAPIVKEIFRLYLDDNLGYAAIRRWLNQRGYQTRSGKPWGTKQIGDIIGGWVYAGYITHWDQVYPGVHEALVDRQTWDAAQALAARRGERSQRQRDDSTCLRRLQEGVEYCDLPTLDADDVDRVLVNALVGVYRNDTLFLDAARAALDAQTSRRPQLETALAATRAELDDTNARLDHWYERVEAGAVAEELVASRLEELVGARARLSNRVEELELQLATNLRDLPDLEEFHQLADQVGAVLNGPTTPAVKALLATLIESVTVGADRSFGRSSGSRGPSSPSVARPRGPKTARSWICASSAQGETVVRTV